MLSKNRRYVVQFMNVGKGGSLLPGHTITAKQGGKCEAYHSTTLVLCGNESTVAGSQAWKYANGSKNGCIV